jgi:hypothetical protein
MKAGDYVTRTAAIAGALGKPATARSKDYFLGAMRRFFADLRGWGWIPRRFGPFRAFATPRPIKALTGPAPRTVADDLWAKLLRAGLNLSADGLPGHGGTPRTQGRADGETPHSGSHYPLEMLRALNLVWLFVGLRGDEIARLRAGYARHLEFSRQAAPPWLIAAGEAMISSWNMPLTACWPANWSRPMPFWFRTGCAVSTNPLD